jgi:hypothetical protein
VKLVVCCAPAGNAANRHRAGPVSQWRMSSS